MGDDQLAHARQLDLAGRRIKVMILVKASPQPSSTYGDTVCVAGVVLEPGPSRWVRLYPVPFRYVGDSHKFKKYDVIDVRVRAAGGDKRAESLKIEATSIQVVESIRGWPRRAPFVEPLAEHSMCSIVSAVGRDMNSVSLAAIRPAEVIGISTKDHPGWSAAELRRFDNYAAQGDLFDEAPPRLLDPPQLEARIKYRCAEVGCGTHQQRIIDWELTALQQRFRGEPRRDLVRAIEQKFFADMYGPGKRPIIFVGNQENPQRRRSFTILGTYYPKVGETPGDTVLL